MRLKKRILCRCLLPPIGESAAQNDAINSCVFYFLIIHFCLISGNINHVFRCHLLSPSPIRRRIPRLSSKSFPFSLPPYHRHCFVVQHRQSKLKTSNTNPQNGRSNACTAYPPAAGFSASVTCNPLFYSSQTVNHKAALFLSGFISDLHENKSLKEAALIPIISQDSFPAVVCAYVVVFCASIFHARSFAASSFQLIFIICRTSSPLTLNQKNKQTGKWCCLLI